MYRESTSCLLLLLVTSSVAAQVAESSSPAGVAEQEASVAEEQVDVYERSLLQRAFGRPDLDPGYRLSFRLVNDIPLPGPLPDGLPRIVDGQVEINVVGGVARTGWQDGAVAQIDVSGQAEQPQPPIWAEDPAGRRRARFLSSGHLIVQKRCGKCREVWRGKWRLKVPGTILTRPLLTENRIYFGAQDNRVYSLKKKNGHRLWVTDLPDRVSEPVVLWDGTLEVESENGPTRTRGVQVILVVPDGGSVIVALDARGGREMARYDLRVEEGRLLGVPLRTPDGKILVARERYRASEASLMVLELNAGSSRATDATPDEPAEGSPDSTTTPGQ